MLSPFFYPEPISTGKYNTYLVEELVSQGYKVDVWCSHPIYPSWVASVSNEQLDGVRIFRGGSKVLYPKNIFLRRVVLELWYCFYVFFRFLFSDCKYDVVIPVFPPSFFAFILSKFKKKGARVIGIVHDLQGVYVRRESGFLKRIIGSAISFVEKRAFRVCDHIIYLSNGMRAVANKQYSICDSKTSVHFPFVTIDEFVDNKSLDSVIEAGEKSLVYSGALGAKQNAPELIELFRMVLTLDPSVTVYIFSEGALFEKMKADNLVDQIKFFDLVAEEDLPGLLLRSKVQVVPQIPGSSNGSLPSKLPNLIASGVGIFCITDIGSELIDILDSYHFGETVTTWDNDKNAGILVDMLNSTVVDNEASLLLDRFTREGLVNKISRESDC